MLPRHRGTECSNCCLGDAYQIIVLLESPQNPKAHLPTPQILESGVPDNSPRVTPAMAATWPATSDILSYRISSLASGPACKELGSYHSALTTVKS